MNKTTGSRRQPEPSRPLEGLRVLDASSIIAGPMAGNLLAEYGAEVIKIEHPDGDESRRLGSNEYSTGLWWKFLNRNKKCITLNLGTSEGADLFRQLAQDSDVVIENFRPGRLDAWGLTYESLAKANPGLVMLRLTGFGQLGPYAQRPGFGTLAEAMSGLADITGDADGPPMLPGFALGDMVTGILGAASVAFKLWQRDAGEDRQPGGEIDLSLSGSLLYLLGPQIVEYDQIGIPPTRQGNSAGRWPRNILSCADDRWVAYSAVSYRMVRRVLDAIGHDADPRFATPELAQENNHVIDGLLSEWMATRDRIDVLKVLSELDVPAAPVNSIADVVADPHFVDRHLIGVHDGTTDITMPAAPFRIEGALPRPTHAGPERGVSNADIYGQLGISATELSELRRRNVV